MASVQPIPSFVEWAFGADFAAKLTTSRTTEPRPADRRETVSWLEANTPDDDEFRPTAEFGYSPAAYETAFWAGYNLGLERENASAPGHYSPSEVRNFNAGWFAGHREWERRLEEMCGSDDYAEFSGRITDRDMYPYGGMS